MKVVEAMHGAAGNHEDLSGAYLRDRSFDGEGEYAFEAIGGLFVAIVAMGTRDFAAGSHVESELRSSTASVGSDTFTTVASSWDRNPPRTATDAIFQIPSGSFAAASSVLGWVLGKRCDHLIR